MSESTQAKRGTAFTTMPCAIKRSSARDGKNQVKVSRSMTAGQVDPPLRCAAFLRALGLTGASMRSTPTSAVARGSKHLLHGFRPRLRFQKCYSPTLWNQMGRSVQDHSWRWTCLFAAGLQRIYAGFMATHCFSGHFSSASWLFSTVCIHFVIV